MADEDGPKGDPKTSGKTRKESRTRGRKQSRPTSSDLDWTNQLLSKPFKLTVRSKPETITTLEAIIAAISLKAIAGDQRALAIQMAYKSFAAQTTQKKAKVEVIFVDNDYTRALGADNPTGEANDG